MLNDTLVAYYIILYDMIEFAMISDSVYDTLHFY